MTSIPLQDDPLQDDNARRDWLCLSLISGVGPRTLTALIDHFESATAVLDAPRRELAKVQGVGSKIASAVASARDSIDVDAEWNLCQQENINILTRPDPTYPRMLREIHDPPATLFCRGTLIADDNLAIGIVGSRHATRYGLAQAERLAGSLARAGMTIVSGLARGIDAAAHRGALDAGGRTIAVLGSGVLNIYPPEHQDLASAVAASGSLMSESPPRFQPLSGSFPQRNRIITGLSLGVIVVEAAQRSGALISARHAMEQGREVFAVPGRVDSRSSRGCHQLIRDGARLVESADDVLDELGPLVESLTREDNSQIRHPGELKLNEMEQKVLQGIGDEATSIDQVVAETGLPVAKVLSTLSVLEMRRLIHRISGSQVSRV